MSRGDLQKAIDAMGGGRWEEAERLLRGILDRSPEHIPSLNLLSVVLMQMGRVAEAEGYISRATAIDQSSDVAFYNHGLILKQLNRPKEALEKFSKALALNPNVPETWNNRGTVFNDLKDYEAAVRDFDRAIGLMRRYGEAYANRGKSLVQLQRYDEALASYDQALALRPDLADAWFGYGLLLSRMKRHREASAAYARVRNLNPGYDFISGYILHQRMLCCDWNGLAAAVKEIGDDIAVGKRAAEPFGWQGVAESEESLQACARIWNRSKYPRVQIPLPARTASAEVPQRKIRVGYLSGEFRDQATSHLMVGLFESHDKSQFEIVGFDNGWDDGSAIRARINRAMDRIIDIRVLQDDAAAARVRDEGIDILVNLNGYFGEGRTGIFAYRPAPVQVNYLGFPGTLGADYMDYIIADKCVLPPESRRFYDEKIAYLPNSYQVNDRQKAIADTPVSRAEQGLPADGIVFCCFNNTYKVGPVLFDSWMRILRRIDDGVLWLIEDNADAARNLRAEAQHRGIDPSRLVFAKRVPLPEHLARHRLADLFLDTLPYNAHTTASDSLWAGVPVITQKGNTFPGRVAASLLQAIGLPELITHSREEYEALAIGLALDRRKLRDLKAKLDRNRLTTPLFDTALFARHIEAAYVAMLGRHRAGLPPDHIEIEP